MDVKLLTYISIEAGRALRSLRMIQTEAGYASRNMGTLADQMGKGASSAKIVGQALYSVAGVARIVGGSLITAAGAFATFGAVSSKAFMDVETEMLRVKAVTGATEGQYKDLTDAALRAARATGIAASKQAEGQGFLAMAGFKAPDIKAAMPGVTALATIGQMDFASSADIVTNILTGMGMGISDLDKAVNSMVNTFTNSNTNIRQMGDAFKYAGPIAKQAGVDVAELSAAVGLLGNAGIQGEMAGTSLRNMMIRLMNPTAKMQKVQKSLGVAFKDANGKMKSYVDILREVERVDMSEADIATLFGTRAMPSVIALLNQGSDALATFAEENRKANAAGEMMSEMLDSYESRLNMAKATMMEVAGAAGGVFKDAFVQLSKQLNMTNEDITNLKKQVMDLTVGGIDLAVQGLVLLGKGFLYGAKGGQYLVDIFNITSNAITALVGEAIKFNDSFVGAIEDAAMGTREAVVDVVKAMDELAPEGYKSKRLPGLLEEFEAIKNQYELEKEFRASRARMIDREIRAGNANTKEILANFGNLPGFDESLQALDNFSAGWEKSLNEIKRNVDNADIYNRMKDGMESFKDAFPGANDAQLAIIVKANYDSSWSDVAEQIKAQLSSGVTQSVKESLDSFGAFQAAMNDEFIGPYLQGQKKVDTATKTTWGGLGSAADAGMKAQKKAADKGWAAILAAQKKAHKAMEAADKAQIKAAENKAKAIKSAMDKVKDAHEAAAEAARKQAEEIKRSKNDLARGILDMAFDGLSDAVRPEVIGERVAQMNLELQMATMSVEEQQIALAEQHNAVLERRLEGLKALTNATHSMVSGYYDMQAAIESTENAEAKKNLTQLQGLQILNQLPDLAAKAAMAMGASSEQQVAAQMMVNTALGIGALIQGLVSKDPMMLAAAALAGVQILGGAATLLGASQAKATYRGPKTGTKEAEDRKRATKEAIEDALKAAGLWQPETRDQTINFYGGDPLEYRQPLRASSQTVRQQRRAGRLRI